MVVPLQTAASLSAGRPVRLFDTPLVDTTLGSFGQTHFALTADAQKFLVSVTPETTLPMMIVHNWR